MKFLSLVLESEGALTLSEKVSLSAEMIVRGLGTVFIVLACLWATIALFGAVSKLSQRKSSKTEEAAPAAATPAPASNDGEIAAAITAAIEAYRASEGLSGTGYRVVSFKKRNMKSRRGSND